jgi:hypothetical protein
VLDAANVPEKKSGPPRLIIAILSAFLAFGFTSCWVIARALWDQVSADDPRKRFAGEVWQDVSPIYLSIQLRGRKIFGKFAKGDRTADPSLAGQTEERSISEQNA